MGTQAGSASRPYRVGDAGVRRERGGRV